MRKKLFLPGNAKQEKIFGKNNCHHAFTMAEVLIVLGIIGIIAALTIPNLMGMYRKSVVETSLKKFYTAVNQAILLSVHKHEAVRFWAFAPENTPESIEQWFNRYFGGFFNTLRAGKYKIDGKDYFTLFFEDGSGAYLDYMGHDWFFCTEVKALENFEENHGRKCFKFGFYPNYSREQAPKFQKCYASYNYSDKGVEPYVSLLTKNADGTIPTGERFCTEAKDLYTQKLYSKIIQLNGWQIPKDYPVKF